MNISFLAKGDGQKYLNLKSKLLINDDDYNFVNCDDVIEVDQSMYNFENLTIGVDNDIDNCNYLSINDNDLTMKELYEQVFHKKWNVPKDTVKKLKVIRKIFEKKIETDPSLKEQIFNFSQSDKDEVDEVYEVEKVINKTDDQLIKFEEKYDTLKKEMNLKLKNVIFFNVFFTICFSIGINIFSIKYINFI